MMPLFLCEKLLKPGRRFCETGPGFSKLFFEQMIEVAQVGKTAGIADIQNIQISLSQQIDGIIQALFVYVLSRSFAVEFFHSAGING